MSGEFGDEFVLLHGADGQQHIVAWTHIVGFSIGVVVEDGEDARRRERVQAQVFTSNPAYTITLVDDEARRLDSELLRRAGIEQPGRVGRREGRAE